MNCHLLNRKFKIKLLILISILILSLQSISKADDIRDFEIEGMSIGDSLLDYKKKKDIESKKITDYKSKKFSRFNFKLPQFEIYDTLQVHFKTADQKYIIHNISGIIFFKNNIEDCYRKKDEIVESLSNLFQDETIDDDGIQKYPGDPTGKSITNTVYFDFKSGAGAKVGCAKFSEDMKKKHNTQDQLRVTVNSKEYLIWLRDEAY